MTKHFYWLIDDLLINDFRAAWKNDQEVCGFLMGPRTQAGVFAEEMCTVRNRHSDPTRFFQAETDDLPDDIDRNTIIGAFHTHVGDDNALPSQGDLDGMPEGYLGVIYRLWPSGQECITLYTYQRWLSSNRILEWEHDPRLRQVDGIPDNSGAGKRNGRNRPLVRNTDTGSAVHTRRRVRR